MGELCTSRRAVAVTLALSIGLTGCGRWINRDDDRDHYIRNTPSPHSQNASIPEGRVLPPGAEVQFSDGAATYLAPSDVAASTGLLGLIAFCGNPIDKRDPQNLYASLDVRKENKDTEIMAGIPDATVCADGTITESDRPDL